MHQLVIGIVLSARRTSINNNYDASNSEQKIPLASVQFPPKDWHQDISFPSSSLLVSKQKNHSTTYRQHLTDLEPVCSIYETVLTLQKLIKKLPCLLAWQDENL